MTHAHDRLLELASKATPGPWTIARDEDGKPYEMLGMFKGNVPDKVIECRWGSATERGANDYAYIAACDPQTISSLILENRRLRNALEVNAMRIEAVADQIGTGEGASVQLVDWVVNELRHYANNARAALQQEVKK